MKVNLNELQQTLEKAEVITLATSAHDLVTVRQVSPLAIGTQLYIRTSAASNKAKQMTENPNVAVCVSNFYFSGKAKNLGKVNLSENEEIKKAYKQRYPGAFSSGDEFIQEDEVFFAIQMGKISQWIYNNNIPVGLAEMDMNA